MIVKGTKQLGNFKRGINIYVPKRIVSAAPSGILVASTDAIVLSGLTGGYYSELNGTYLKQTNPSAFSKAGVEGQATGAVYFNSSYIGGNKDGAAIWYGSNAGSAVGWQITYYDDNAYLLGAVASADSTTVPINGYSNPNGYTGTIALASTSSVFSYASTASITSDFLGFTITKENINGDTNLLYQFDESYDTPPRPANYYGFTSWDYDTGTGDRAILAFNTSATTYYSNQPSVSANISLSPNTWYLIKFAAGNYDEGSIPPIPDEVRVNTSSSQSASNIPRALWSPNTTITAALPTAVLISGAGTDSSNGNYVWDGAFINGKRGYIAGGNSIYWNESEWRIEDAIFEENTYRSYDLITWVYINGSDEQTPTGTLSYS